MDVRARLLHLELSKLRGSFDDNFFGGDYLGRTLSVWVIWACCFFCSNHRGIAVACC